MSHLANFSSQSAVALSKKGRHTQFHQPIQSHIDFATSCIPLDTILPEICTFIIGFSCTAWNILRTQASSLADGALAGTILIHPRPPRYCLPI